MMTDAAARIEATDEVGATREVDQKRAQSAVEFPYSDLGKAVELVQTMYEKAAGQCSYRQLAVWLKLSINGGTMRSRYSAARKFGLVGPVKDGQTTITDLGKQVLSPQVGIQGRAKATAFLNVPLYRAIYDQQQGYPLPPAPALEQLARDLGVAPKQAPRARQAFVKSASDAGFIDHETQSFIRPAFPDGEEPDSAEQHALGKTPASKQDGGDNETEVMSTSIDPIIMGLIDRLPESGEEWPLDQRKLWLGILESTFKLVYKEPEGESTNASTTGND